MVTPTGAGCPSWNYRRYSVGSVVGDQAGDSDHDDHDGSSSEDGGIRASGSGVGDVGDSGPARSVGPALGALASHELSALRDMCMALGVELCSSGLVISVMPSI